MNRIHVGDKVRVIISDEEGRIVYECEGTDFRNVEVAIATAYAKYMGKPLPHEFHAGKSLEEDPSFFHYYKNPDSGANDIENYSYEVNNLTKGTSARYRVNAGGHVHVID